MPAAKHESVEVLEQIDTWIKNRAYSLKLSVGNTVDQKMSDGRYLSQGDLKKISRDTYQLLFDTANDYLADKYDPNVPDGIDVPVHLMFDLPDNSKVRMKFDPSRKSWWFQIGAQF